MRYNMCSQHVLIKGGVVRGIAKVFAKQGTKLILLDIAPFESIHKSVKASIISVMKCGASSSKSVNKQWMKLQINQDLTNI